MKVFISLLALAAVAQAGFIGGGGGVGHNREMDVR